jgi:hypothetical protein
LLHSAYMTLSTYNTQHNKTVIMLSAIMLSIYCGVKVVILSVMAPNALAYFEVAKSVTKKKKFCNIGSSTIQRIQPSPSTSAISPTVTWPCWPGSASSKNCNKLERLFLNIKPEIIYLSEAYPAINLNVCT